mmetsp:Transcript_36787/g.59463  ORF Transcript_36787/g.59463 Transcript_36787/m.59463 type:complete len:768 (+) Transcript_36787:182-2485(+)
MASVQQRIPLPTFAIPFPCKTTTSIRFDEVLPTSSFSPQFLRALNAARNQLVPHLRSRGWASTPDLWKGYKDVLQKSSSYFSFLRGLIDGSPSQSVSDPFLPNAMPFTETSLPPWKEFLVAFEKIVDQGDVSPMGRAVNARNSNMKSGACPWRKSAQFTWSDSLRTDVPWQTIDAACEALNVLASLGQWFYAAAVFLMESLKNESFNTFIPEIQFSYTLLLAAAGAFDECLALREALAPVDDLSHFVDLSPAILKVLSLISLAQAEEIVLLWGSVNDCSHTLLTGIAVDISQKFTEASSLLESGMTRADAIVGKLKKFFPYKSALYKGIAYKHMGESLRFAKRGTTVLKSTQNEGMVVASFQKAVEALTAAGSSARDYVEADPKGAGKEKGAPHEEAWRHLQITQAHIQRFHPQNGKAPVTLPDLPQAFPVVAPTPYEMAAIHEAWRDPLKWSTFDSRSSGNLKGSFSSNSAKAFKVKVLGMDEWMNRLTSSGKISAERLAAMDALESPCLTPSSQGPSTPRDNYREISPNKTQTPSGTQNVDISPNTNVVAGSPIAMAAAAAQLLSEEHEVEPQSTRKSVEISPKKVAPAVLTVMESPVKPLHGVAELVAADDESAEVTGDIQRDNEDTGAVVVEEGEERPPQPLAQLEESTVQPMAHHEEMAMQPVEQQDAEKAPKEVEALPAQDMAVHIADPQLTQDTPGTAVALLVIPNADEKSRENAILAFSDALAETQPSAKVDIPSEESKKRSKPKRTKSNKKKDDCIVS